MRYFVALQQKSGDFSRNPMRIPAEYFSKISLFPPIFLFFYEITQAASPDIKIRQLFLKSYANFRWKFQQNLSFWTKKLDKKTTKKNDEKKRRKKTTQKNETKKRQDQSTAKIDAKKRRHRTTKSNKEILREHSGKISRRFLMSYPENAVTRFEISIVDIEKHRASI